MGKFATVLQGHIANRDCETVIGEGGFELLWNFLQIRAALQRSDDDRLYETTQKEPRFTALKYPDCKQDQKPVVAKARATAKKLVKEVGGQPYEVDVFNLYLRNEFPRLVWGYGLERVCRQLSRAMRPDFFAFYHMVATAIDRRGVEDMPFPEDIVDEAASSVSPADCGPEIRARIGESAKDVREIARHLGIWSNRTGTIRKQP